MKKVVKLKQSDVETLVKNIVEQMEFDDFDTKIQPEELPNDDFEDDALELTLGQDENGTYYVMKNGSSSNPEIVAKTQ